ncbi:trypsin-like peptidase domain-containing protein [Paragemmobacter ruber]|uniref:PDZ domain-containing protein n=1 Tax=Paragemmobacter ruber TaxID=1985673 RepID=A0ABW9Y4Z4_9RHOB|nr:trypsin-like peptidase domain-containing protein [Rhodobacter ruber]NBE07568.1 PDZ domain-containing protein [Rhodobacter ruber]
MIRSLHLVLALSAVQPMVAFAQTEVQVPQAQAEIALSFAPVVKQAAPAVVNIYATRIVQARRSMFADDPFFNQFFEALGPAQPRVQNSLGSGVIVSADGIVVSNYHVVGQATEIRVVLNDRREYAADVILGDEESDLAVLRLRDAEGLPFLPLRNSDELEVGDLVLAIGNPFGVGQTVSSGIVSGLARSALQVGEGRGYFIQTDAAINPGNSGGALVDVQGRLVGINTAILTRGGGSNGIGFAIPANLVRSIVDQAQAGATRFARPWAGVTGQAMDAALAEGLGLARPDGVVIAEVHPQSPFAAAGVQPGDVILSLGGAPTNTPQEVIFRMAALGVGAEAELVWLRGGQEQRATMMLAPAPDDPPRDQTTVIEDVALRGLTVVRINPAVTEELGLPMQATGVAVLQAEDLAERAGFQRGDVILGINGAAVGSPADVEALAAMGARVWEIDLIRQGQPMRLRFRF